MSLFVIYYLTKFDDIILSGFWVIPKITSPNLCKPIHDVINYFTSICPFESWRCGKEGKKLHKLRCLENEKSFLDEIRNIFHSFWRVIIWWKNKKLKKKVGTSFKQTSKHDLLTKYFVFHSKVRMYKSTSECTTSSFLSNNGNRKDEKSVNFVCWVNKNYQKLLQKKNTEKQEMPIPIKTLHSIKRELIKKFDIMRDL